MHSLQLDDVQPTVPLEGMLAFVWLICALTGVAVAWWTRSRIGVLIYLKNSGKRLTSVGDTAGLLTVKTQLDVEKMSLCIC